MRGETSAIVWIAVIAGIAVVAYILLNGGIAGMPIIGGTDLSYMYHTQLEELSPEFLGASEANCEIVGGTWVDTPSKIGCFDIPVDAFDFVDCSTVPMQAMKLSCESVHATFVCETTAVGCMY